MDTETITRATATCTKICSSQLNEQKEWTVDSEQHSPQKEMFKWGFLSVQYNAMSSDWWDDGKKIEVGSTRPFTCFCSQHMDLHQLTNRCLFTSNF